MRLIYSDFGLMSDSSGEVEGAFGSGLLTRYAAATSTKQS